MRPRWASSAAAALALGAVAAAAPPAGAAGLSVSPARIEADVTAGSRLPTVKVRNDTGRRLAVEAFVLEAGQELSGLAAWRVTPQERAKGRRLAVAAPSRFEIAEGAVQSVRVRVTGSEPLRGRGSYGVLVVSASETGAGAEGAGVVSSRVRLSSNLLLTYPGKGGPAGGVTGVAVTQGSQRTLLVGARVHNRGRLHGPASGSVRVRDADGKIVWRGRLTRGVVIPDARRDLPATVKDVLPAGRYTLRARVKIGKKRSTATTSFRLVAPGTLPKAPAPPPSQAPPSSAPAPDVSLWDQVRDWAATHVEVLLIAMLALLVVVVGGVAAFVSRSLRASRST